MFVSLLTYNRTLEHDDPLYAAHRAFVEDNISTGEFLCAGPRVGVSGGVIIVRGDDEDAARTTLDADPFVRERVAVYELHQFRVGLADPTSGLRPA